MRYAVVHEASSGVVNLIVAEPGDPAPLGCSLVALGDEATCGIGWTWDGVIFVEPVDG